MWAVPWLMEARLMPGGVANISRDQIKIVDSTMNNTNSGWVYLLPQYRRVALIHNSV